MIQNKCQTPCKSHHLNLLQITAIMSNTNTVMIAIVISRFVAILVSKLVLRYHPVLTKRSVVPTCHSSQGLNTPIRVSFTLSKVDTGVFDDLSLPSKIS